MGTRARQERALRLLEEAAKQLVRAAAELQAKGVDTASLSRPVVMVGDAIRELAESLAASESEAASTRSAPRPADRQLASQ